MIKQPSFRLQELTWEETKQYLQNEDIILFPVGSTEQHGPAGPLGLDSYVAISLAEDAAQASGVLVAPPLWFGDSSHHLGFAGTISLKTETLVAVVKDVISSLAQHGFRKVLVINGHKSANLPALSTACKNLHQFELPEVMIALADPMFLGRGIAHIKEAPEHHAGELEISEVWYKYPDFIRADRLTTDTVNLETHLSPFTNNDFFGKSGDRIEVFWNSREQRSFAPTGSFSPSIKASREKGQKYHEYMVNNLVTFIDWMRKQPGPSLDES